MRPLHQIAMDPRVFLVGRGSIDADGFAFECRAPLGANYLRVIVSNGDGWDHASVSVKSRCPTWEEMEFVRSIVFLDEECAMQLSVPRADHIDHHPYCLHLWRPQEGTIPRPPGWMVGPLELAGKKFEKSG